MDEKVVFSCNRPIRLAEIKFYSSNQPHPMDGGVALMGFDQGRIVFPDCTKTDTLGVIRKLKLRGKTLKVQLSDPPSPPGKGQSIATLDGDPMQAIVPANGSPFDSSPIVMIDGQNFLKDVWRLDPYASAYTVLMDILKNFNHPPKLILFYMSSSVPPEIRTQFQDIINNKDADPAYSINVQYHQVKFIATSSGYKAKVDIDPMLQADLGEAVSFYQSEETLVLFSGDSDYQLICQRWLGNQQSQFHIHNRGRLLVVVSSYRNRSLSVEMRETCNDPNAELLLIEDFMPQPATAAKSHII